MADANDRPRLTEQQELFCQGMAKGLNQRDAYRSAGYKTATDEATDAAASRLLSNVKVANRLAQLRAGAAKRTELTAAHFAKRLERIAAAAERTIFAAVIPGEQAIATSGVDAEVLALSAKEAADVARQHSMDAAKLLGLVIDKAEVTDKTVYAVTNRPQTEEEWQTEFTPGPSVN